MVGTSGEDGLGVESCEEVAGSSLITHAKKESYLYSMCSVSDGGQLGERSYSSRPFGDQNSVVSL